MAMRVNVVNEDPSIFGRKRGLIYEAVALLWALRTGQTAPTVIAGLTNKHVPHRLVKERLLNRDAVTNPQSPAQFKLTVTKKGFDRAVELIGRIRQDLNLREMAEKMGFAMILLDKSMPKLKRGGANAWRFAHDVKLQMTMVVFIRHQKLEQIMPRSAAGNPITPIAMRTSLELDRITVKTGEEKIADWTFSGRALREFGKARLYIELENSKQSTADSARRVYFYNTRLHQGEGAQIVWVLATSKLILKKVVLEFSRKEIKKYKLVNNRYVQNKDAPLYQRVEWNDTLKIELLEMGMIKQHLIRTPERSS